MSRSVRRTTLVDHAIAFYSGGREYGADAFIIVFPDGERVFSWTHSYTWSREVDSCYCVTSALMALEAWAHRRIESGESVEAVLVDVLGPPGSPAAFLLVAVDLILSHWPKSREAAVPFVACPELLCMDHQRQLHDVSMASLDSLKKRPSRSISLEDLLREYAIAGPVELREMLKTLLHRATERLGPPDKQSSFRDPAFMVVQALNRVDPSNWREVSVPLSDGTQRVAHEYVPPETERQHLAALQHPAQDKGPEISMQYAVMEALKDSFRSSPEFAAVAVEWAQRVAATPKGQDADEDEDDAWMLQQAVLSAAMIAMRDGDAELRTRYQSWARGIFSQALQAKDDPVLRFRPGLRYNPIAISFVGMIHALKDRPVPDDVRALLKVCMRSEPAAAHGFAVAATTLAAADERLLRAVLRCAFAACIRSHHRWGGPEEEVAAHSDRHRQRFQVAMEAELTWLFDQGPEPEWPIFPVETPRIRQPLRLWGRGVNREEPAQPCSRPEDYADHQAAAVWLVQCRGLVDMGKRPWLREMARAYAGWTAEANGAGLEPTEDVENSPGEWNDAYFDLLAKCLPRLSLQEIEQFALVLIISLPDRSFFDILPSFLRSVDAVYFNDRGVEEHIATSIRSALATRLMVSRGWNWLQRSRSASIETHIGPAIAVLFFNDYGFATPANCYLFPGSIERLAPFLPVLEKLVESGLSHFVASVTLNMLEVSPQSTHLPFILTAAKAWLGSYPDDSEFWVAHGFGRRLCIWLENIWRQDPAALDENTSLRGEVDRMLAALVSLGVPEARRLEIALSR